MLFSKLPPIKQWLWTLAPCDALSALVFAKLVFVKLVCRELWRHINIDNVQHHFSITANMRTFGLVFTFHCLLKGANCFLICGSDQLLHAFQIINTKKINTYNIFFKTTKNGFTCSCFNPSHHTCTALPKFSTRWSPNSTDLYLTIYKIQSRLIC